MSSGDETGDVDLHAAHPLETGWTWYCMKNPTAVRGRSNAADLWSERMKQILTFRSVEDFWRLWNNIPQASELHVDTEYYMMREGIKPQYEDSYGRWSITLPQAEPIDEAWLNACLGAIGESIDSSEDITGLVLSVKRGNRRISFWCRRLDQTRAEAIRQSLGPILSLPVARFAWNTFPTAGPK